jgi:hypothetical protein
MEGTSPETVTQSFGIVHVIAFAVWIAAAAMTGRAVALNWRPWWYVLAYVLLIGCAVRFLRFALFGEALVHPQYFVVDTIGLMVVGVAAFRPDRSSGGVTSRTAPKPDDNRLFCRLNPLPGSQVADHSPRDLRVFSEGRNT